MDDERNPKKHKIEVTGGTGKIDLLAGRLMGGMAPGSVANFSGVAPSASMVGLGAAPTTFAQAGSPIPAPLPAAAPPVAAALKAEAVTPAGPAMPVDGGMSARKHVDIPSITSPQLSTGFSCKANDVINMRIVSSIEDLSKETGVFRPSFTHQLFEDEIIFGYKGLRVDWFYVASSMDMYLNVSYDQISNLNTAPGMVERTIRSKLTPENETPESLFASSISAPPPVPTNPAVVSSLEKFRGQIEAGKTFTPTQLGVGEPIETYSIKDGEKERTFELYTGTFDEAVGLREFHRRIQPLLLLFVDGSSFIDDSDPRWGVTVCFEKVMENGPVSYCLVGWVTVYRFFAYPDKERHRVSQMLVLPPFQRMHHGQRLLKSVYSFARKTGAIEVGIEDPSDSLRRLRNQIDCEMLLEKGFLRDAPGTPFARPTPALCAEIRKALLVNKLQVHKCYEILRLSHVDKGDEEHSYKPYRLFVKERLYKQEQEILDGIEDKAKRKEVLHELYLELESEYFDTLTSLVKAGKLS